MKRIAIFVICSLAMAVTLAACHDGSDGVESGITLTGEAGTSGQQDLQETADASFCDPSRVLLPEDADFMAILNLNGEGGIANTAAADFLKQIAVVKAALDRSSSSPCFAEKFDWENAFSCGAMAARYRKPGDIAKAPDWVRLAAKGEEEVAQLKVVQKRVLDQSENEKIAQMAQEIAKKQAGAVIKVKRESVQRQDDGIWARIDRATDELAIVLTGPFDQAFLKYLDALHLKYEEVKKKVEAMPEGEKRSVILPALAPNLAGQTVYAVASADPYYTIASHFETGSGLFFIVKLDDWIVIGTGGYVTRIIENIDAQKAESALFGDYFPLLPDAQLKAVYNLAPGGDNAIGQILAPAGGVLLPDAAAKRVVGITFGVDEATLSGQMEAVAWLNQETEMIHNTTTYNFQAFEQKKAAMTINEDFFRRCPFDVDSSGIKKLKEVKKLGECCRFVYDKESADLMTQLLTRALAENEEKKIIGKMVSCDVIKELGSQCFGDRGEKARAVAMESEAVEEEALNRAAPVLEDAAMFRARESFGTIADQFTQTENVLQLKVFAPFMDIAPEAVPPEEK